MPGSLLTEPLNSSCSHVISSHPTPRLLFSSDFYSDASSLGLSSISDS